MMVAVEVAAGRIVIAHRRWWHAGQTVMLPQEYVAAAMRAGLVVPVGTYVPPVWQG
jgi:sensor c-di-GMP phosphodiesterase-like protein